MKKFFEEPKMIGETRAAHPGKSWIVELLIFLAVFAAATTVESVIPTIQMFQAMLTNEKIIAAFGGVLQGQGSFNIGEIIENVTAGMPEYMIITTLFCTVFLIVIVVLFCAVLQKRKPAAVGFRKNGAVREYLLGVVMGIVLISAAVGIGLLTGSMKITVSGDLKWTIVLFFLGYMFQGMSEEVLCRGYFMPSFARKHSLVLAVVLNSLIFGLLHASNPGFGILPFINLVLCGIAFSLMVIKRGNIWGACAMHSMWNFFQGNFFGFNVSGTAETTSIFKVQQVEGTGILSGGTFGIEGGICTTIIMAALILFILFVLPKKKDEFVPAV